MVTKSGKAPAPRKRPTASATKKAPTAKPAATARATAAKKPKAATAAPARKPRAAPAKSAQPSATAQLKAAAARAELALEDLARGILDKAIKPGVADVQRLAAAVAEVFDKHAQKEKGGGKKKGGKKKLAKIPGQKKK